MAITLRPAKPVTDDELLELSRQNPGYQFERTAKGELVVTPTGGQSSHREHEISLQLGIWTKRDGRGIAFSSSGGFRLSDGALFSPDASWVRRDRWDVLSVEQREGILPLCPDAVFEVRSKSDEVKELQEKMRVYLANGAQIAILIDPYERGVEIYRPGRKTETHRDPTSVALDPELPRFVLDPKPIFASQ